MLFGGLCCCLVILFGFLRLLDVLFVAIIVCVFDDLVLCMFAFGG